MTNPNATHSVQVEIAWPQATSADPILANQFAVLGDGNGFYLTIGHAAPPIAPPTGDERMLIEIKPIETVFLTPQSLIQLHEILGEHVAAVREQQAANRAAISQP